MATLYSQAESNTRKTWLLIFVFLALVIGLGWFFSYIFDNQLILIIAVVFSFINSFVSYWYSDKIVLAMARAKLIEKRDNPELYRLVENLCIASGLPLPRIYILNELQPNAFATGRDEKRAVVAVTSGILEKLDRAELEGVIAHELSHIKNRDMLLGTVVVVLVGTIAMLSDMFLRMTFWGRGRRDRGKGGGLILVIGILAAVLAPLAASLIQLAVSRKREFLADASGALLTRYPEGLARALEKISQDSNVMRSAHNSTAHLYISSPFKGKEAANFFTKLFSTHPPIEERVKALREIKA